MNTLTNKRILLGITGSVAAYKGAELVRLLRAAGAEVQVVLSRGGAEFITPLTLQALSGRPVCLHHLDADAEAAMGHIELARWADAILVAPASADFLARLAQGRADDLLSTVCLASEAPLAVAPAMNRAMWAQSATRDNVALLAARGVRILGPASGEQACGEVGAGRMEAPEALVAALAALFECGALQGLRVVVSAGPTREPLDPVRFLSNRSSGRMGYALARAAAEAGAAVTLISGPVALAAPDRVTCLRVETAAEMREAVLAAVREAELYIGAAAVADYRPREVRPDKLKKEAATLVLELERTPDILAEVAALPDGPFTVGFAAETRNVEHYARAKLAAKGLDMIVANPVGGAEGGFDAEDNAATVLWAGGSRDFPLQPKDRLARALVTLIAERYHAEDPAQDS
ncbi:MAG TPA: bifunctional phosphopantothenoylcysteine decarboxylase/phosphopantothenate--cysteine ligase CoaBC [Gammaproteobacteria bacterium]|nr:bifunctional phosphopantothenoylcysteine decarboxylase/phosphopantothenate--cysteine ligase CoaBC [Gammaproteobacteria bacterium]